MNAIQNIFHIHTSKEIWRVWREMTGVCWWLFMAAVCFSDFPCNSNAFIPKVPYLSFLTKLQRVFNWLFSTGFNQAIFLWATSGFYCFWHIEVATYISKNVIVFFFQWEPPSLHSLLSQKLCGYSSYVWVVQSFLRFGSQIKLQCDIPTNNNKCVRIHLFSRLI